MLRPEYSGRAISMPWLRMAWLQMPLLSNSNGNVSAGKTSSCSPYYMRKDFNYPCHLGSKNDKILCLLSTICHVNSLWYLGCGLLNHSPPFRYFPKYWISHLYLTDVAAAQLRWHPSNTNVMQWIWQFCKIEYFAYGEINERSFSNPHPCLIMNKSGRLRNVQRNVSNARSNQR